MDPINPGSEEYGHDTEGEDARPALGAALPERSPASPARARVVRLVSGELLLTVNPVDGSEIEPCPPGQEPGAPRRRTPEERAEAARAAAPSVPPGPAAPELPLLERQDQRERLAEILARGRSARLTGPAGSGRTALLDAVAADCAELAPDGVVRLSGHHRTPAELLHELFTAVRYAPNHRPDRTTLPDRLRDIGAVVVVDDLEFGGAALDELLAAAPECAFLLAAAPDAPAASADAHVEEVALAGLGRGAALTLLESAVGRTLTDEEANWAGDLWFESEGLPLRFVQAGALLRQRDRLRVTPAEFDAFGALEEAFGPADPAAAAAVAAAAFDGIDDPDIELREIPLPSLGEGAAPAALLASRLSRSAQTALRFAVALGGELPHQAHLPALVGDTHADAALGELLASGLLSPVGSRYRLATGVLTQLLAHGYGHDAADRVHSAGRHYAWWAGHPSVTPDRAAAESDALLAALAALVPSAGTGAGSDAEGDAERRATAVLLARTAAPAFAAGLHWGAWERALRAGQEAARLTGDVAEEAYFHHELGVLAICAGNLERARAELEASIGMRGVLADKRGTVAGRRALALVADLSGDHDTPVAARAEEPVSPPRGTPALRRRPDRPASPEPLTAPLPGGPAQAVALTAPTASAAPAFPAFPDFADEGPTLITRPDTVRDGGRPGLAGGILTGARRNLAAVGAGALLVVVLGTVVTLGATSGSGDDPATNRVTSDSTATEGGTGDGLDGDEPPAEGEAGEGGESGEPTHSGSPSASGSDGTSPSASSTDSPTSPGASGSPSASGSSSAPSSSAPSPSGSPTGTTAPATTQPPASPSTTTRPPRPSTTPPTTTTPPPPTTTPPTTPPQTTTPPPTTTSPPATGENSPSNSASATLGGGPSVSDSPAASETTTV
ncbi:ATP-binding protein [Streptomyces sp. NBC_00094]|uniref:ATP-binding protein n=1 Tax=Streptomyces sp. NBC_00094 TaxID=2903620 RepID=UPI002254C0A1|nr:ATP-binding protein [Streptomyces sp. NBC_00094]MCX5393225.1 ATP-binding protein [Streptomyces sp. NBC_00094]